MSKYQVVISRNEPIDIIGIATGVPAKVDTGAFRSAIHASNVKLKKINGQDVLTCNLLGHMAMPDSTPFETTTFSTVTVVNSTGHKEERYIVTLRVKVGPKVFNTTFTLADRSKHIFPVLVGRTLLKGRFLVDVNTGSINRQQLKEQLGIKLPDNLDDLE